MKRDETDAFLGKILVGSRKRNMNEVQGQPGKLNQRG